MEITKDFLNREVVALAQQKQQALGNALRYEGAAQFCTQLVKHLDAPEPNPKPAKSPPANKPFTPVK